MSSKLLLASLLLAAAICYAGPPTVPVLQSLAFGVIHDNRTFKRSATDKRYSVWTDKASAVAPMLQSFGFEPPPEALKPGHIMAVFLNDNITEDLTAIAHNKNTRASFADYADSGIQFKLGPPGKGMKHTHVTVVVFAPIETPSHLGMRGMITGGLSEKKE